ncbi:AAA family ATPase [Amycolatopsis sp. NPDC051071]|uniref:AAA family ATPase n=1 Tax=Amycolatopsis sp. NPDC051071 TaxID=3154637 RepID=UPI003434AB5C
MPELSPQGRALLQNGQSAPHEDAYEGTPFPDEPPEDDGNSAVDARCAQLRAQLLTAQQLRDIQPPEPLVDGYLYRNTLAWLHGKPGTLKSFTAVDIACCVDTGTEWHGHPVKQGTVLYLIAEGAAGLSTRVDAWELAHGTTVDNAMFLPVPVQMLQSLDVAAFTRLLADLRPVLVIIDTQSKVTLGADENSTKDMARFVDALDQLRRACGACVLVVHHEPRAGENMRGSTALEGGADTILRITRDGNVVEISNTKQKDAPEQPPLVLAAEPVGGSLILSQSAVGIAALTRSSEHSLLTVLRDSFGTRGATKTELREASDLPKTTYYRAVNELVSKGLVVERKEGRSTIYTLSVHNRQTEIPTSPTDSHE